MRPRSPALTGGRGRRAFARTLLFVALSGLASILADGPAARSAADEWQPDHRQQRNLPAAPNNRSGGPPVAAGRGGVGTSCCQPGHGPGCDDPEIESCVCSQDPFCCETLWDDLCVAEVDTLGCGTCGIGACCLPDQNCADGQSFPACFEAGGLFQGDGSNCDGIDCAQLPEACCLPEGGCSDQLPFQCLSFGGQPQGPGTNCFTVACPGGLEACCFGESSCADLDPAECVGGGGQPQGPGTDCLTVSCSITTEACCFDESSCADLDPADCSSNGGVPQGPGTDCLTVSCSIATEACCFDESSCADLDPADCSSNGGVPQGPGTDCGTVTCPVQPEACCLTGGSCLDVDPAECPGTPQGPGTTCDSVSCEVTLACCFSSGSCADLFLSDCVDSGGVPQAPGSNCDETDCPPPPQGACCLEGGECIDATESDCLSFGGEYEGDGTNCETTNCEEGPCAECGPGPHWIDSPPCLGGFDGMPSGALVGVDLDLDCLADTSLIVSGPVTVLRTDPLDDSVQFPNLRPTDGHFDVIDTEIISMSMSGGGVTLTAGAGFGQIPLAQSLGAIAEQPGNPHLADSFFNVFFEVDLGGGNFVYNQDALQVTEVIDCIPPRASYLHPIGCWPLYTSPVVGEGILVANLVTANHDTFPPPRDPWNTWRQPGEEDQNYQDFSDEPIPEGFFDPGSDPFVGRIEFAGDPISPSTLGDADTIIERGIDPVEPGDPAGTAGTTAIRIFALSLVSTRPVTVTYGGDSPEMWDVAVDLSVSDQPAGTLSATKTHANGGTFDSTLPVLPRLTFTRRSDGTVRILDAGVEGLSPLVLSATGTPFVHAVDPSLDIITDPASAFVPGVEEVTPGDPTSQEARVITEEELLARHQVCPPRRRPPPDYWYTYHDETPDRNYQDVTLPGGFFGPGCEPFTGRIQFKGRPFNTNATGNADTCVQRDEDPVLSTDPPGTAGTTTIQIIDLSMVSVDPITVTCNELPTSWDVQAGLSPTAPPIGTMFATKTHDNGGTFDSVLSVQPLLTFSRRAAVFGQGTGDMDGDGDVGATDWAITLGCLGGPLAPIAPGCEGADFDNDGNLDLRDYATVQHRFTGDLVVGSATIEFDTGQEGEPPVTLQASGVPFVHAAGSDLDVFVPQGSEFIPSVAETVPGDPTTQEPQITEEEALLARHTVCPPREKRCIYEVTCVEGACENCPFEKGDLCYGAKCPGKTCAVFFSSTCGESECGQCCLEFTLVGCRVPDSGMMPCPNEEPCDCCKLDLGIDSDNDGLTTTDIPDDDPIEEDAPGKYICVNNDDDNEDGSADKDDAGATAGEDDLAPIIMTTDCDTTDRKWRLTFPAGRVRVWEASDRTGPVTSGELQDFPLPPICFVEGLEPSTAPGDVSIELAMVSADGTCVIKKDLVKATVVRFEFINDANNVIPKLGQDAHLDVSNSKTDVNLPSNATFAGPPTTDPDNFRTEAQGLPAGLTPKVKLTVTSGGADTYTHTFDMVAGPGLRYRLDEHVRLVSNDTDDAHLAHQTPKVLIGDDVKAELILGGRTICEAELPVCRPFAENHRHAIRTCHNYFVEVDIPGTTVAADSDVPTTDRRMDEAWAQCCVRFTSTTRERTPVANILRVSGVSTGGGNVNVTVDGTAVGPIAIAAGRSASQVADDIAAGINAVIGAGTSDGFNSFPASNNAHVVSKKGMNVAYTALAETVPGIAVSVPAMDFTDGIGFVNEEPALAANYTDGDANTIDFYIVDTLTTGNRGDAWPVCLVGATSDIRHVSFIVLSAGDTPGDNPHTAAHEAGRFLLDFCGLHPGPFNLQNGTSAADSIAARKRLTDAQCMTAFTTSDGALLRQE